MSRMTSSLVCARVASVSSDAMRMKCALVHLPALRSSGRLTEASTSLDHRLSPEAPGNVSSRETGMRMLAKPPVRSGMRTPASNSKGSGVPSGKTRDRDRSASLPAMRPKNTDSNAASSSLTTVRAMSGSISATLRSRLCSSVQARHCSMEASISRAPAYRSGRSRGGMACPSSGAAWASTAKRSTSRRRDGGTRAPRSVDRLPRGLSQPELARTMEAQSVRRRFR